MSMQPVAPDPGPGGLRIPGRLALSFQRYLLPVGGVIDGLPTSLGALPVAAAGDGSLLIPVADGEGVWIGVSTEPPHRLAELGVVATLSDGSVRTVAGGGRAGDAPLVAAPAARLAGIPRPDGRHAALTRTATAAGPGCAALAFRCRIGPQRRRASAAWVEVVVRLVEPAAFAAATGQAPPPPPDPAAGYGGWRLP